MATATPRGIRKVSELITQKGRTLIFTEDEAESLLWSDIPDGSLKINPITGLMSVKLEGESGWTPAGIKNDGTISIARDTKLVRELYTITNLKDDDGNFVCENEDGELRHYPYDENGYMIFYLEKGSYQMLRNQISMVIDNCLYRTTVAGDLEELSETRVKLKETLEVGQEVTILYSNVVRIGNPYPRVFINDNAPDNAEVGDVWYDTDDIIGDDPNYVEDTDRNKITEWSNITGQPTTLTGYGITDKVASATHIHKMADIIDLPLSILNAANAASANMIATANEVYAEPVVSTEPAKTLTIVQSDGTTDTFDGTEDMTVNIRNTGDGTAFDSDGKLVFPNGMKLWIEQ